MSCRQLVRPFDRRPERPLANFGVAPAAQEVETVAQALEKLLRPRAGARAGGSAAALRGQGARRPARLRGRRRVVSSETRAAASSSASGLEPEERSLLAALSVFRGGWTLEAAEQVAAAELELMQSLVDKSLVRRWESGRFGMLETIREFAAEQLPEEDRDALLRRLLGHLVELFEAANLQARARGEPRMGLAQEERPNIDVALAWATQANEARDGLRLLELIEQYWATNDPLAGRARVDALLAVAGDDLDPATLAHALRFRGMTFDMSGETDLSEQEYQRAIELLRAIGDESEAAQLTLRVANAAARQGDLERASSLATAAVEADRPLALAVLAQVAFARDDADEGARLAHEAAEAAEAVGFRWWRGVTLLGAAEELLRLGELGSAQQDFVDAVTTLNAVRDLVNLPIALAAGAALAARLGDRVRAGKLWGAAEADAERAPRRSTAVSLTFYEPYLEPVRGDAFEEARVSGRTLSLEEAVEYALEA